MAVEIIEAELRSAQYEVWFEASRLVLTGDPIEVARHLRQRAERTIRPTSPELAKLGQGDPIREDSVDVLLQTFYYIRGAMEDRPPPAGKREVAA